jgi:hypothetical protein
LQLMSDILATQKSISQSEQHLEKLKNVFPLNSSEIIQTQENIVSYKSGIKALRELEKELF